MWYDNSKDREGVRKYMDNNKRIYLIIGVITITMLIMGVTTAWFTWNSTTNTDVSFNVEGLDITYTGNANVLNKKLYPTASMTNTDNVIHKFSLVTTSNIDIYTKISLDIIKLDDNLKDASFRWNLYKEDTSIASGNFSNATVGSDVLLTQTEMITTTPTNYTLYIWIDGENYNNPLAMGGKEFNFKLKLEAGQQAYATPDYCFNITTNESNMTATLAKYYCFKDNEMGYEQITDLVIPSEITKTTRTYALVENPSAKAINNCKFFLTATLGNATSAETVCNGGSANGITLQTLIDQYQSELDKPNYYSFTASGMVKVVNNTQSSSKYTMTTIENNAFYDGDNLDRNSLTNVVIPNSVTIIGGSAFYDNNLTNISIPDNVTTIGDSAFPSNNLKTVYIGKNSKLSSLGVSAFSSNSYSNPNLTTIYNLGSKSLDWNLAITGTSGTAFVSGTVTTEDGRTVTITTSE